MEKGNTKYTNLDFVSLKIRSKTFPVSGSNSSHYLV